LITKYVISLFRTMLSGETDKQPTRKHRATTTPPPPSS